MQVALRMKTRVLPGHRLEIVAPELTEGEDVEVVVTPTPSGTLQTRTEATAHHSIWQLIHALSSGPRSASSWEEVDCHLQEGRDAWDR